jgi:hypothetical protein
METDSVPSNREGYDYRRGPEIEEWRAAVKASPKKDPSGAWDEPNPFWPYDMDSKAVPLALFPKWHKTFITKGERPAVTPCCQYRFFEFAYEQSLVKVKSNPYLKDLPAARCIRAIPELRGTPGERLRFLGRIRKAFEEAAAELNAPLYAFTQLFRVRLEVTWYQADRTKNQGRSYHQRYASVPDHPSNPRHSPHGHFECNYGSKDTFMNWARLRIQGVVSGKFKELPELRPAFWWLLPEVHLVGGQAVSQSVTAEELAILGEVFRCMTERLPGLVLWVKGIGETGPGLLRVTEGQAHATDLQLVEAYYDNSWDRAPLKGTLVPQWATMLGEDVHSFIKTKRWMASHRDPRRALLKVNPQPSLLLRLFHKLRKPEPSVTEPVPDLGTVLPGGTPMEARVADQLAKPDRVDSGMSERWNINEEASFFLCLP